MPADIDNDDEDIDLSTPVADDLEGTAEIIRKALRSEEAKLEDDPDIFSPLPDAPEKKTVSIEDGMDLIDKATSKFAKDEKAAETTADDKPAEPEPAKAADDTPEDKPAVAPAEPELAALLEGIPDDRREALTKRIGAADEVMGLFKGRDAELQMHGINPQQAVSRLLDINAYAMEKPAEYLAWAASEIGGDKAQDILGQAAATLGLKLVKADEPATGEIDPFEDPEKVEMRAELARLRGQGTTQNLGPDTPERRASNDLRAFVSETGPDGKPLRPLFERFQREIATRGQAHVAKTGQPLTTADLARFYDEEVEVLRSSLGIPAPSGGLAAQTPAPVADQNAKSAADLARAKSASKNIDGTGQGAARRPALDENADLASVIRYNLRQAREAS